MYTKDLKPCGHCGSEDVRWCAVSHRPYCGDCGTWGAVNHGKDQDAISAWNVRYEVSLKTTDNTAELTQLREALARAEGERDRLINALELDRSVVAQGLGGIREALRRREWLRLGRGSYEYDDQRWMDEFSAACDEIVAAMKPLEIVARNITNCPETQAGTNTARELLNRAETAEQELGFCRAREANAEEGKLHYFNLMQKAEKERDTLKAEVDRYKEKAQHFAEALVDAQAQLTTSREEGYRQGTQDMRVSLFTAIELARESISNDPARKNGYFECMKIIRAESSTLPAKKCEDCVGYPVCVEASIPAEPCRAYEPTLPRTYEETR